MTKMIKKLFSVSPAVGRDVVLLFLRISIAALMLVHGLPKLQTLMSGEPVTFISFMGMSSTLTLTLVVFAEVFCSVLLLVGFGTRVAVIPLIITMLVAVFHVHASDPFVKQEMGLHYLLAYGILLVTGSGKYSADSLLERRLATVPQGSEG